VAGVTGAGATSGGPKIEPGVWLGSGTTVAVVRGAGTTGVIGGAGWITIGEGCRNGGGPTASGTGAAVTGDEVVAGGALGANS